MVGLQQGATVVPTLCYHMYFLVHTGGTIATFFVLLFWVNRS